MLESCEACLFIVKFKCIGKWDSFFSESIKKIFCQVWAKFKQIISFDGHEAVLFNMPVQESFQTFCLF